MCARATLRSYKTTTCLRTRFVHNCALHLRNLLVHTCVRLNAKNQRYEGWHTGTVNYMIHTHAQHAQSSDAEPKDTCRETFTTTDGLVIPLCTWDDTAAEVWLFARLFECNWRRRRYGGVRRCVLFVQPTVHAQHVEHAPGTEKNRRKIWIGEPMWTHKLPITCERLVYRLKLGLGSYSKSFAKGFAIKAIVGMCKKWLE